MIAESSNGGKYFGIGVVKIKVATIYFVRSVVANNAMAGAVAVNPFYIRSCADGYARWRNCVILYVHQLHGAGVGVATVIVNVVVAVVTLGAGACGVVGVVAVVVGVVVAVITLAAGGIGIVAIVISVIDIVVALCARGVDVAAVIVHFVNVVVTQAGGRCGR